MSLNMFIWSFERELRQSANPDGEENAVSRFSKAAGSTLAETGQTGLRLLETTLSGGSSLCWSPRICPYRIATVKAAWLGAFPTVTTTGTMPVGVLSGTVTLICRTPAVTPGTSPMNL
jgi:hypothetical protein